MQNIIFTDLDATLLDHDTYSYKKALPALRKVKEKNIPLIICTSKTRSEIEHYRDKFCINDPFIVENGGAIFIPKKYFNSKFSYDKKTDKYYIIELGKEYPELIKVITKIKDNHFELLNFNDMTPEEISKDCNLSIARAKLAKKRGYDEPFKVLKEKDERKVIKIIEKDNLRCIKGGRYFHLTGNNDKGKAVKILTKLFEKKYKQVRTYAFGDSKNDLEMLRSVGKGYLVQRKDGSYASSAYLKAKGIGPEGWNKKVLEILENDRQKKSSKIV